ncbi:MAG: class I SAM-dependent methyltransferase [Gemmatimonadota bacterium]
MDVLDIGCGRDAHLAQHLDVGDHYHGVDFYEELNLAVDRYTQIDLNEQSLAETLDETFDVVFCGEVIEHLFAPDKLVGDIRTLMRDDAILVLSTPNLAYWVNRLLLLFGISPLYLENAAEMKLGRRFRALGQGNETEGHVKVFTYRAMLDLLELARFDVLETIPTVTWPSRADKWIGRLSPSLAANNVFVVRKATHSPRAH